MKIIYDSKDISHKKPFGCLKRKQDCEINIYIPEEIQVVTCFLSIEREDGFLLKIPMTKYDKRDGYRYFNCSFSLSQNGLYFYYFKIISKDGEIEVFKDENKTSINAGCKWQITCYDENYDTPDEFKGIVYYQIFPDRFAKGKEADLTEKLTPFVIHEDTNEIPYYLPNENGEILNNNFFGGNLDGITKKLPYLKELNVNAIYLNPIFMAYSNHRYDTADYKRIDPMLGNYQDFKNLCEKAHEMDMKIIIDCAFSHTGSNSIYFDKKNIFGGGAYHDPHSKYRSWFQFEQYPYKYNSWWGIHTLPCVNELDPGFMDYIIYDEDSVLCHWIKAGADGIRLDVADELPDEFIYELRKKLKEVKPSALLIGEVWEDASNKISYGKRRKYFTNTELDSIMNYPFRTAIKSFANKHESGIKFADTVMTIAENYPKPVLDCVLNSLSTHDTMRIINALTSYPNNLDKSDRAHYEISEADYLSAVEKEKMCAFLQFTLPGSACIYYGDEIGMYGFEDPFNRRFFSWDKMDKSLLEFYKALSELKTSIPALKTGDIRFLKTLQHAFVFVRELGKEKVAVAASVSDEPFELDEGGSVIASGHLKYEYGKRVLYKNGFALLKL